MRGESMKGKSKKSTYSTTFGVDPKKPAKRSVLAGLSFTERGGFEPPVHFWHTRDFQSRTFGHSVTSPCLNVFLFLTAGRLNALCLQKQDTPLSECAGEIGRAAEDRTRDLLHPMQARYQTALRPEIFKGSDFTQSTPSSKLFFPLF